MINKNIDSFNGSDLLIKVVNSEKETYDVLKLRYIIYCLEKGFEKADDYPQGLEYDQYDPYSAHIIAYVKDVPVGTARLIMPNKYGLPVENVCNVDIGSVCDSMEVAEISRFAVYSKRAKEFGIERSKITLGLIKQIYLLASQLRTAYCFAAMNRALARFLSSSGIIFIRAGEPVDYHGIRIPYFIPVHDFERNIFTRNRELYENLFATDMVPSPL